MKIVKGVLWGIAAALLYLIGLFFIVGNIDMSAVMLEFSTLDAALLLQSDQIIALLLLSLFVLAALPLIHQVTRLSQRFGTLILVASLATSLLLLAEILTFEDRRLLVITSALLGSLIISLMPLTAIALFGVRIQKRRLENLVSLQKLQIPQPEKLFFKSIKQLLSRYASVALVFTYGGFLYLYSMYLDTALVEVIDIVIYSFSFIIAGILYLIGYVRSVKRLLQ